MKTCSRCRISKPLTEFGIERARQDGRRNYCKVCAVDHLREYRRQQPERFRQYERERLERHGDKRRKRDRVRWVARAEVERGTRARFGRKIRKNFGITLEEYDQLVAQPCALCGKSEHIVLDHCHTTGKIRGPLCKGCNAALGVFADDPVRLRAAAEYLEAHAKHAHNSGGAG